MAKPIRFFSRTNAQHSQSMQDCSRFHYLGKDGVTQIHNPRGVRTKVVLPTTLPTTLPLERQPFHDLTRVWHVIREFAIKNLVHNTFTQRFIRWNAKVRTGISKISLHNTRDRFHERRQTECIVDFLDFLSIMLWLPKPSVRKTKSLRYKIVTLRAPILTTVFVFVFRFRTSSYMLIASFMHSTI